jgi:hypothetical protein
MELKVNEQAKKDIRCLPLKKFPAMIHYSVNDNKQQITVHAVFHTALNPEK